MSFILTRYTLREILFPTVLALVAVTFISLIAAKISGFRTESLIFMFMRLFFQEGAPRRELLTLVSLTLPSIIIFVLPMALLIGIVVGVGRLAMDLEIVAMESCGANMIRILFPMLLIGAALSVAIGFFTYRAGPLMLQETRSEIGKILLTEFRNLEPGRVYDDLFSSSSGLSFYFNESDPETHDMMGVTVLLDRASLESSADSRSETRKHEERWEGLKQRLDRGEITEEVFEKLEYELELEELGDRPIMIFSKRAAFSTELDKDLVRLELHDGSIHLLGGHRSSPRRSVSLGGAREDQPPESARIASDRDYVRVRFGKMTKSEHLASSGSRRNFQLRTTPDLREAAADARLPLRSRTRARATILERYSMAFECFVLAFFGLPLALTIRPTGKSVSVLLAFGLILVYHWLIRTGYSMVESDHPIGEIMIFLPNVLFALLGSGLWWRVLNK